jgi:hypothetical protein
MLIAAAVTENEGHALTLAIEQMRQLFVRAGEREWKIDCDRIDFLRFDPNRQATICIVSLLRELEGTLEPLDRVEGRLRDELGKFVANQTAVYLCTIFRACDDDAPRLERIRRLNLLAVELSHDLDAGVIDFDRQFSDIGAKELQTSYRREGPAAREVGAYVIVKTLLAAGAFDEHLPAETIEQARALYDRAYKANTAHS